MPSPAHCATFVEAPWEIDALMSRTEPSILGLCLDTGHCAFGGGDPVATLDKWRDRIWHMHLKDCDPAIKARAAAEGWGYIEAVRQGVFCELLNASGYDGWLVVEQDVLPSMGSPAESAVRNRRYLKTLGV